ncbi:glycosyltransferase group 1 family [Haloferula helveola]|uniref:Glycosyltransferase group 1 family n=1 Tax=Haloferula helveola TaxID=490095 RepID=A0ABM7R923_9BACT|nr:glycosyltransferase group 1 family [Haloferula helveola]
MTLLFYDDRPLFGGHEAMTLLGLEAILAKPGIKVHFIVCEENTTLVKRLETLRQRFPALTVEETDEQASRFEAIRHFFSRGRIADLSATIRRIAPDAVVSVQGGIEPSSLGIIAANKCGVRAISYLAMPHSYQTMGAKLGRLLDWGAPMLIERPDAFITSCDELAAHLRARGAKGPVEVVFPGIDTERFAPADRDECRRALDLPVGVPLFACVGRIDLRQKQQDRLVRAVSRPIVDECHLVIGGEGPDSDTLDQLIEARKLGNRVRRIPWADTAKLYPAADALVIPSRYEGVPLVMLEALACGTPVLGSDCDGMRDLLPDEFHIDASSSAAVAAALRDYVDRGMPKPPEELCERVRNGMSIPGFQKTFAETLLDLVKPI